MLTGGLNRKTGFSRMRRNILTATAALAGSLAWGPLLKASINTGQIKSDDPVDFVLGNLRAVILTAGQFEMSTAELFPEATEELLIEYGLAEKPFIFKIHPLFIENGKNKTIIDPGGLADNPGRLLDELTKAGINPADIDTVIITHAHFDHYMGCVKNNGEPAFPNARYYLQRREWNYWSKTEDGEAHLVSEFRKNLLPIEKQFIFVDGDRQIIPGIDCLLTPGHSPGHMTVHIGRTLAYTGDALLQPVHVVRPGWVASWNRWPQQVVQSRKKFLHKVAADQSLVVGTHFPVSALGRVTGSEGQWHLQ